MLYKKYEKEGVPRTGGRAHAASWMTDRTEGSSQPHAASWMTDRHYFYNDQNVQTAYKAPERRTGRGNDQMSIYTTGGIIRVYRAFWRVGKNKIKYHILLL